MLLTESIICLFSASPLLTKFCIFVILACVNIPAFISRLLFILSNSFLACINFLSNIKFCTSCRFLRLGSASLSLLSLFWSATTRLSVFTPFIAFEKASTFPLWFIAFNAFFILLLKFCAFSLYVFSLLLRACIVFGSVRLAISFCASSNAPSLICKLIWIASLLSFCACVCCVT